LLPTKAIETLREIKNDYFDGYSIKSYSQEGDGMILRRIFEKQKVGSMSMLRHITHLGFQTHAIFINKIGEV
jgi:hypothetical protein